MKKISVMKAPFALFLIAVLAFGPIGCTSKPKQYRTVKFKQDVPQTAHKSKRTKSTATTKGFW